MTSQLFNVLILALCCLNICNGQFLQPRKLLEKVLDLHEKSRNVLSGGDSMKLNVDLSSAKEFPVRDDLRLRVFNKDNNVTLCDTKLFDHVDHGHFPCSFDENDAQLKHGANNFELEVYSDVNWRIYATQKIPDIHYFDSFAYEGYYDSFMSSNETETYIKKTLATSTFAVLLALLINKGPTNIQNDLNYILSDIIGYQLKYLRENIVSVSQISYDKMLKQFLILITTLKIDVFNIYKAGLESPYSMVLSGSRSLADTLSVGMKITKTNFQNSLISILDYLCTFQGDFTVFFYGFLKALTLGSNQILLNLIYYSTSFSSLLYSISNSFAYYAQLFFKNGIINMKNLPKSTLLVLVASGQFLFDIFSAGLSSPAGMILSGKINNNS